MLKIYEISYKCTGNVSQVKKKNTLKPIILPHMFHHSALSSDTSRSYPDVDENRKGVEWNKPLA